MLEIWVLAVKGLGFEGTVRVSGAGAVHASEQRAATSGARG
jgi:hypothetical protein